MMPKRNTNQRVFMGMDYLSPFKCKWETNQKADG